MEVFDNKRNSIILSDNTFSKGGEGEIREVTCAPDLYPTPCCVKIYFRPNRTELQRAKVEYMVNNPPEQIVGDKYMIGWPLAVIFDGSNQFLGFIMRKAYSGSKQLVHLTSLNINRNLENNWHQRFDRANNKSFLNRLKLINNIAIPIHNLHATKHYVLKDLKPQNILITYDGSVAVVDMDSVQIIDGKTFYSGAVATAEYVPMEYYNRPELNAPNARLTDNWDNFAMAVVFYQILFGLHPFAVTPRNRGNDGAIEIYENIQNCLFPFGSNAKKVDRYPDVHNEFKNLSKPVQDLFIRAFAANDKRPTAQEWGIEIHNLINQVSRDNVPPQPDDVPSTFWNIVAFLSPIIGWGYVHIVRKNRPNRASDVNACAWSGLAIMIIFLLIQVFFY